MTPDHSFAPFRIIPCAASILNADASEESMNAAHERHLKRVSLRNKLHTPPEIYAKMKRGARKSQLR